MVGKIQSNKVKFLLPLFDYIHSLDSLKLARKISEVQLRFNKKPKIFIQVNIGNEIQKSGINVIQDRSIYEDAHIFAPNLHAMGLLSQRDYQNYKSLFELMENMVTGPDLMIYLRSSIPNLVGNIHKRGREFENSISIDYLSRLNERYEAWIHNYDKGKLLIIDVDELDFVDTAADMKSIIDRIDSKIKELS